MIKNIIFDWDGVLKDSLTKFYEVTKIMFKEFGREPISVEEVKERFDTPYMKFWNYYFPDLKEEIEKPLFHKLFSESEPAKLYPESIETIKELKERNINMFIVSSSPKNGIFPDLEKNNVLDYFKRIIYEINEKDAELKGIIKDFNLDLKQTAFISDTTGDIKWGQKTNIKTIAITWGFQTRERLSTANPDIIIDNIKELIEVIDKEKL